MKNQGKAKFSLNGLTSGVKSTDLAPIYTMLDTLSGVYFGSGFLTNEVVNSGLFDISVELDVLGHNTVGNSLLNSKLYGSVSKPYLRPNGFSFGY